MVKRLQIIEAQPIDQFAGIDLVSFVARFEQSIFSRIAHRQLGHMRLQQIV
jgi:hypothetical protein